MAEVNVQQETAVSARGDDKEDFASCHGKRMEDTVEGTWFSCSIPRTELKALTRRKDWPGLLHFGAWISLLVGSGYVAWLTWGTLWAIPVFFVYGTIFASSDARWHECAHGTAFKSRWLNEGFHILSTLMTFYEPTVKRWSHARHHTHTSMPGIDPEIQVPRPARVWTVLVDLLWLRSFTFNFRLIVLHALGIISEAARAYVPESQYPRMIAWSRAYLSVYLGVVVLAIALESWLPLLYFGLPRLYGGWLHAILATTQHPGLAQDVWDHRLNSRTIHPNPVFAFLYVNMQYHLEHHMYPMVPFFALHKVQERLKDQLPPPYPSVWAAYREIIPTLWRQRRDAEYYVRRPLPEAAAE